MADDDFNDEFEDDGSATTIDPDALSKLREMEGVAAKHEERYEGRFPARFNDESKPVLERSESPADEFEDQGMTMIDPNAVPPSSGRSEAPGSKACPECGVMITPGYPKCPRCHATLSVAPPKPSAGGTSVVGRTVPWTIVVIAAIATGIIYYLAERDPDTPGIADETSEVNSDKDEATEPTGADEELEEDAEEEEEGDLEEEEEEDSQDVDNTAPEP